MRDNNQTAVHLIIEGRVQGVCFRMCAVDEARSLGLCGWVRNLPDGNVELVAEGESKAVDAIVEWCREGPPHADVTGIQVEHRKFTGSFAGFEIRR